MKTIHLTAALAVGITLLNPVSAETIIHNVNLVTMGDDGLVSGKAVVIDEGRITAIIPESGAASRDAAVIIDAGGKYLTPGMVDAHMHHYDAVPYVNYIANGVTTVIGLGQRRSAESFLALREAIEAGEQIGPQIYTGYMTIASHIDIEDPDEARDYVRKLKPDGYDLVKVYNNIPQDVFDAVVDEAAKNDLSVFGHLPRNFPVEYSLSHGLDVVAHAEEFYFAYFGGPRDQALPEFDGSDVIDLDRADKVIDLMVKHDIALIPNIVFTFVTMRFWDDEEAAMADPEMAYWPEVAHDAWRQSNGARRDQIDKRMLRDRVKYNVIHDFTRRAQAAGVLIATGTDAPERGVLSGASVHSEMRELVKSGLTIEQALAAATSNGGKLIEKYIDKDVRLGVIAPGYEADLVLVSENPLDNIRNMKMIDGVMVDGVWHDRHALDAMRDALVTAK